MESQISKAIFSIVTTVVAFAAVFKRRITPYIDLRQNDASFGSEFWGYIVAQFLYFLFALVILVMAIANLFGNFHADKLLAILIIFVIVTGLDLISISWFGISFVTQKFFYSGPRIGINSLAQFLLDKHFGYGPVLIRDKGVDALSETILNFLIHQQYSGANFAMVDENQASCIRANSVLFGCVIEQLHHNLNKENTQGWPELNWGNFYHALSIAKHNGNPLFSPETLNSISRQPWQHLVTAINIELAAKGENTLPVNSQKAAEISEKVRRILADQYESNAENIFQGKGLKNQYKTINKLKAFPCLDRYVMAPQCMKLMVRFGLWDFGKNKRFVTPFAVSSFAYLLDNNALTTIDEAKVSVKSKRAMLISELAIQKISGLVANQLKNGGTNDIAQFSKRVEEDSRGNFYWRVSELVDFYIWREGQKASKNDTFNSWKVENGKILRKPA